MVVSSAIGCQLGEDAHGVRVVVVTADDVVHRYYSLEQLTTGGLDEDLRELLKAWGPKSGKPRLVNNKKLSFFFFIVLCGLFSFESLFSEATRRSDCDIKISHTVYTWGELLLSYGKEPWKETSLYSMKWKDIIWRFIPGRHAQPLNKYAQNFMTLNFVHFLTAVNVFQWASIDQIPQTGTQRPSNVFSKLQFFCQRNIERVQN